VWCDAVRCGSSSFWRTQQESIFALLRAHPAVLWDHPTRLKLLAVAADVVEVAAVVKEALQVQVRFHRTRARAHARTLCEQHIHASVTSAALAGCSLARIVPLPATAIVVTAASVVAAAAAAVVAVVIGVVVFFVDNKACW
jgi:hypothetical protein